MFPREGFRNTLFAQSVPPATSTVNITMDVLLGNAGSLAGLPSRGFCLWCPDDLHGLSLGQTTWFSIQKPYNLQAILTLLLGCLKIRFWAELSSNTYYTGVMERQQVAPRFTKQSKTIQLQEQFKMRFRSFVVFMACLLCVCLQPLFVCFLFVFKALYLWIGRNCDAAFLNGVLGFPNYASVPPKMVRVACTTCTTSVYSFPVKNLQVVLLSQSDGEKHRLWIHIRRPQGL